MAARIIRSIEDLNKAVHVEMRDEIRIDLTGELLDATAPCVRLHGNAAGAVFRDADFRGTDLSGITGEFVIEDSMVRGCIIPRGARLVRPCYELHWSQRSQKRGIKRGEIIIIAAAGIAAAGTIIGSAISAAF